MAGKIALVSTLLVLCLAGCLESYKTETESTINPHQLSVLSATIQRLQAENLPALECIQIWQNNYGPGLKLTTPHYEIFTTFLEPLTLRHIPGFVESAYYGYNSQLPTPIETTTKFTVYLFADRQQWENFTKTFAGRRAPLFCKIKAGAYYLNGACVVYDIGRKRTLSALGHEGWHQFNSRLFEFRLPSWLDEGIAMLFEASRCENGMYYFEPAENTYRLDALKETLAKKKVIPLKELTAINPGQVLATNQAEAVSAFYCQSYALVRFLREADQGKYLDNYRRLLLDGFKGDWPLSRAGKRIAADRNLPRTIRWNQIAGQTLFEQYIGGDFYQLEKEYLAFCRQITSHLHSDRQK